MKIKQIITESTQLNEFDPGESGFGPFTVYLGDHLVDKFSTFDEAKEEIEFIQDSDPRTENELWKIADGTGETVWEHDPGEAIDAMRSAKKIQFLKPKDMMEEEMPDLSPQMQQAKQQQQVMMSDTPPQDDNLNMLKAWAEYSPHRRIDYYVIAKFGNKGPNRNIFSNSVQNTLSAISNFPDMSGQELYDQFDLDQRDADRLYVAYENVADELTQSGLDEGETWSKHNNPRAGGMSKKSVSSYRRSHPGSKIQTAVTTKPSKLKKGSKAAKRRKSFCARMKGMKKSRTSAKTARDPNSNINKSLRRWNCESIEQMQELVMIAEQFIAKHKK